MARDAMNAVRTRLRVGVFVAASGLAGAAGTGCSGNTYCSEEP
ncbi:hypothetical protein AB0I54_42010 [Streptomyces sp. NPDC050625]